MGRTGPDRNALCSAAGDRGGDNARNSYYRAGVRGHSHILALLLGNALFGLVGMFLAAPAAAFTMELLELAERGFGEAQDDGD